MLIVESLFCAFVLFGLFLGFGCWAAECLDVSL